MMRKSYRGHRCLDGETNKRQVVYSVQNIGFWKRSLLPSGKDEIQGNETGIGGQIEYEDMTVDVDLYLLN